MCCNSVVNNCLALGPPAFQQNATFGCSKILPIIAASKFMVIKFEKYQGAGNDFVMIDDRGERFDIHNEKLVHLLCDRHFGIGSDGLILLRHHAEYDFEMIYFNSDGKRGSMCGNGGRCAADFARKLDMIGTEATFLASDGPHRVFLEKQGPVLGMRDVKSIETIGADYFMDTGSPHYVIIGDDPAKADLLFEAKKIRYNDRFRENGTNVNLVSWDGTVHIRTYERGVENETLACGTGVTAAALAVHHAGLTSKEAVKVQAKGGLLEVRFNKKAEGQYSDIWLAGPVAFVFNGEVEV